MPTGYEKPTVIALYGKSAAEPEPMMPVQIVPVWDLVATMMPVTQLGIALEPLVAIWF